MEPPTGDVHRTGPDVRYAAAFGVAYFAGSELGYMLSLGPAVGGTFWPPSGISLAFFLLAPVRLWPHLLATGLLANYLSDELHGQVLPASIGFAIANLAEPIIGAALLRRILPSPITLTRLQEMIALSLVVAFGSTPTSAAIGATTAQWYTMDPPGFAVGWRTWWVGDAVGAIVLAPCVIHVITGWRRMHAIPLRRWLEALAFVLVLSTVTQIVFTAPSTSLAMPFLVFPVLLWASLRMGPIGVGAGLTLVVLLTTDGTAAGQGPLAAEHLSLSDRLVALQIYVGVIALSFHGLSLLWYERARTAAALRAAHSGLEARHRRIVEQSPMAIVAIQADGRVRELNPAWQQLWASPHSNPGESAASEQPWQDPRLIPLLNRAFAGEIVELPERELAAPGNPDAPFRRVRGFAYPVKDEAGRVAEVVLIERDITDEVRAQQQLMDANRVLREREDALSHALAQMAEAQHHREQLLEAERFARAEAERASQLKDEFLATLSHELRTPLHAIVGWTHILRRSSNEPALAQAVDTIERNALAQARLIDELLDMSRIMAGKMKVALDHVRLEEVVTGAGNAMRPVAEAKGVSLSIDVEGAAEAWVAGDAARLQQVVTNLLGNGIKFTPPGGRVEAALVARPQEARLTVRDTGQGISPEFLPSVFERFRQADGSTTRRHGGLGLGLSIVKHLVEAHGGSVLAHSDGVGCGTTFTVTLPLAAHAPVHHPAPADVQRQQDRLTDLRVLVVDDEADAREFLRRLLLEHGCEVEVAASAEESLALLSAQPFHILLTDIGMPGTDGYELLRRLRAGRGSQPRAIAVTAFARREDRDRALAAGFDGHLAKPIDPTQLLQTLADMVPTDADSDPSAPSADSIRESLSG